MICETLYNSDSDLRLVIPSVVFVEIFDKWSRTDESSKRIFYECFEPLNQCDRVDVRELDEEVLLALSRIGGVLERHEINDKIIVATAEVLEAPILTKDPKIHEYADALNTCTVVW